jgi:hypothetical protein
MPRIAKFNYSDYSVLDSLYEKTGNIPTYSSIYNEISKLVPDYMPSGTIIAKYRSSWLELRGLDSKSAVKAIERISSERSSLLQQFQNIVSELETVLSSLSELAFLEQKNEQIELENQKLLKENAFLKGQIDGFQQALSHVNFILQQRDIEISIEIKNLNAKMDNFYNDVSSFLKPFKVV